MTTETDEEYLWREYVLTIQNDRDWYLAAHHHGGTPKDYTAYHNTTLRYADRIRESRGDTAILGNAKVCKGKFIRALMRRVTLALWHEEDDTSGVATGPLYDEHLASLNQEGIPIPGLSTANANPSVPPTETLKETTMTTITTNPAVAIEVKTLVFGQDVATMSTDDLINAIRKVEQQITSLKGVQTPSKKIAQMIADQEAQLAAVVAVLDAK